MTKFHGEMGSKFVDLVDATDEVVYVLEGRIRVTVGETSLEVVTGGVYYIPAGESRDIEVLETTELLCFFSQAGDGAPFPDDK